MGKITVRIYVNKTPTFIHLKCLSSLASKTDKLAEKYKKEIMIENL